MKFSALAAVSTALLAPAVSAIAHINITGNAFWNQETGERFYIRGVDYQPGGSSNLTDPLADETTCKRDIASFEELGINTIRVYSVDNSLDHSACMSALEEAGIYLILDLNTPDVSISRTDPACSYNADYLQNVFATVDVFADYDNVLGFFAGNEVINNITNTFTATYVKAVVRDVKKYLKARDYRQIPVGYSAADVSSNRLLAAEYFNCGDDADARIDMFGVNDYSWCGHSSFTVSGYQEKVQMYTGYSIPIFLSEFGCNTVGTERPFTEIESIYSTQMSGVFSGGLVYEYTNETNDYGLVQVVNDTAVTKLPDFMNLKAEYNKTSNPSGDGGYLADGKVSECPAFQKGIWEANNTLPELPTAASVYYTSGAGEPLGTDAGNTQFMCDDDEDVSSSSSSSSTSTTSTSSSSSSSSSASSTSTSASSSSSSSSKSKALGSTVRVPSVLNVIYSFADDSLLTTLSGLLLGGALLMI